MFRSFCASLCLWIATIGPARAEDLHVLCYHDVRDDVRGFLDPDQFAVATSTLIAHLDWMTEEGYKFVTLDAVLDSRSGKKPLPPKAVLLTFDDCYVSFYTRVFPILELYDAPAVFALVTEWIETEPGGQIDYGSGPKQPRTSFITWDQAREMQASGLIEFASHSDRLHRMVRANPGDSLSPAVVTRRFLPETATYESLEEWKSRLENDLRSSADLLEERIGQRPRAMIWPYGEANRLAVDAAKAAGMSLDFSLGEPDGRFPATGTVPRHLIAANAPVEELASQLRLPLQPSALRVLELRIDDWFHDDLATFEKRLDLLIEYGRVFGPNRILLDVFARDPRTGRISGAYLPGTSYPLRADVANRLTHLLSAKIPAGVILRLPADTPNLKSLSETLSQYLPLMGLAIPAELPEADALSILTAARHWRPELARFAWTEGEAPQGKGLCFVRPEHADPSQGDRLIPLTDLDAGPQPAAAFLQAWLRQGARHTAVGPIRPSTSSSAAGDFASLRAALSANSNPYRESLIRQLQRRDQR